MTDVSDTIQQWMAAGEPLAVILVGALVAACFVVFSALRVLLYIPQIATCWTDSQGCRAINLYTWCSWMFANASTGLYMWMFQGDILGLCLNLGSALMCAVTVAVTLFKRTQHGRDRGSHRAAWLSARASGRAAPSRASPRCRGRRSTPR